MSEGMSVVKPKTCTRKKYEWKEVSLSHDDVERR